MSCYCAKVGDKIIGNKLANIHHTWTKEGWIGTIEEIDRKNKTMIARGEDGYSWIISMDCFDFYEEYTAEALERALGLRKEALHDYH